MLCFAFPEQPWEFFNMAGKGEVKQAGKRESIISALLLSSIITKERTSCCLGHREGKAGVTTGKADGTQIARCLANALLLSTPNLVNAQSAICVTPPP